MNLTYYQFLHVIRVAKLIEFIYSKGYTATWGYTFRSPEECRRLAALGLGTANSLHQDKLAVDFNIFKNGKWLKNSEDLKFAGDYWKSLSTPDAECAWGGDFKDKRGRPKPDGNHFSIRIGNRK